MVEAISFRLVENSKITYLVSPLLETAGVFHAFTTRKNGVSTGAYAGLNLRKNCGDDYANVTRNYEILSGALGFGVADIAMSLQVHGRETRRVYGGEGIFAERSDCDALVSDANAVMMIFAADCVPILLYDMRTGAAAAAHAGWRGTVLGTPVAALERMRAEFGSEPGDVAAAIGPCIERDCYEVDSAVADALKSVFGEVGDLMVRRGDKYYPDLRELNALALSRAGVKRIDIDDHCTKCLPELFWSHRRTGSERGVQGALIRARCGA